MKIRSLAGDHSGPANTGATTNTDQVINHDKGK
jgi:hypothetical protein